MPRYFLEVAYMGKGYSGFQVQENAKTIQSEIQKAFQVLYRLPVELTGSSRTDAGVHALQNYFHFDWETTFEAKHIYNLNAILPGSIVVKNVSEVLPDAHARFHAQSRLYRYVIYTRKNPFLEDRGWYFPYSIDTDLLREMAELIKQNQAFYSFSKRNTQVKTFHCSIYESSWRQTSDTLEYEIRANRFLRGMVRGLVGTMLRVARGGSSMADFQEMLKSTEMSTADFSAPGKGLYLIEVAYPEMIFRRP